MKPEFSELSFAFAYMAELAAVSAGSLTMAPSFPSTTKEGKKGFGYDVKVGSSGVPLFLQFKLSHSMRRKNSAEFSSGKFIQGKPVDSVFRFYLMALGKSKQTSLMLKLEKKYANVFYVAPAFSTTNELNKHFMAKSVLSSSRRFLPSKIKKMPDKKEHFVSFRVAGKAYRFSADPMEIDESPEDALIRDARQVDSEEIVRNMMSILKQEQPNVHEKISTEFGSSEVERHVVAQFLSRAFFGCELVFFNSGAA